MNNLEALKQELITQKDLIELKGGKVTVANNYPSPAEITTGIRSIVANDLTISTATEADVMSGKTFFSGNSDLKTGTGLFDANLVNHLFMSSNSTQTTEDTLYYEFPSTITSVRPYLFYNNFNQIHITLNPEIKVINNYAFYGAKNLTFENFESITGLLQIGDSAFYNGSTKGFNFASLPNTMTSIGSSAFYNAYNNEYIDFRFPDKVTSLGAAIYRQLTRKNANSLDLTNYKLSYLTAYCFEGVAFNCDLIIPSCVRNVSTYFNYDGCFKNIVIPASVTQLGNSCFASQDSDSVSNYYLKTVTFESETPPTFGTKVFALQNIENGFKIYVPDTAIEQYKAVANLSSYVDCIYAMSEKE